MKIFGSIQELVELVYRKGSNTVTLKPNTAQAANVVVSLPNLSADDTSVTEAATQTLTNKSVSGDSNTLSNIAITSLKADSGNADAVILRAPTTGAVTSAKIVDANISLSAAIALTKLATVTASRALQSDGSGNISASSITSTELGHLSGVTSNIQTQLNSKEPTITILPVSKGGTNSSTSLNNNRVMISSGSAIVEASALTASRALASDASGLPTASATTSTELGYLSGVTSAVQTQINAKADTTALTAHTGASSGVHGVTGSVVGTTDTQVLTNKDHDGGTASNASRFTLPKANKSILDGLTRKQATLVYGTDTNKVYADDGSTLREIGSGSSGINYLSAQYGADSLGTVQTSVGDVLASSTRSNPTQWGNSAASALITQSTDGTLRGTTNYLVQYSANAQFVESPLFTIDGEDLGKPLLVQFDVSGVSTADDVQVYIARYDSSNVLQERILVAGTASATTPNSAQVPTGVTTFKGFFIPSATSTDKYAVRWLRNANNTSMRLDTFLVGPQSLAQGAVVTGWQSYTPTFEGFGTVTSVSSYWRRIGDSIEITGSFAVGTPNTTIATISLPTGLSLDSNKINGTGQFQILGSLFRSNTTATAIPVSTRGPYAIIDSKNTSTSKVYISISMTTSAGGIFSAATGQEITALNDSVTFTFRAPISQWSSGTTTLADRAVEEYAYNTSGITTAGASDTTSFGYGPTGATIGSIASTTINSNTTFRIRFQTAVLPTDSVILELDGGSSGARWIPFSSFSPYIFQATSRYGARINQVNSTDFDIDFGNKGWSPSGASYAGDGSSWSGIGAYKWRLRKVSSGAAVGFPVSARNIVGDTSGTVVPKGMIGEVINGTAIASSVTIGTSSTAVSSIALTPGRWALKYNLSSYVATGATSGNRTYVYFRIRDSADTTTVPLSPKILLCKTVNNVVNDIYSNLAAEVIVDISQNTTYLLRGLRLDTNGTGLATVENSGGTDSSTFYAIRIA